MNRGDALRSGPGLNCDKLAWLSSSSIPPNSMPLRLQGGDGEGARASYTCLARLWVSPVMGRQVDTGRHLRRSESGPLRPVSSAYQMAEPPHQAAPELRPKKNRSRKYGKRTPRALGETTPLVLHIECAANS